MRGDAEAQRETPAVGENEMRLTLKKGLEEKKAVATMKEEGLASGGADKGPVQDGRLSKAVDLLREKVRQILSFIIHCQATPC